MNRVANSLVLFAAAVALGWAGTSVALRRQISAVWRDAPLPARAPLPPPPLGKSSGRLERIASTHDVADFAEWLREVAAETSPGRLVALLEDAKSLPEDWRVAGIRVVLDRLADLDPAATLDLCLSRLGDGTVAWNALANAVRLRAGADPASLRPCLEAVAIQLAQGDGGMRELARLMPEDGCRLIAELNLPRDHPGVRQFLEAAGRAAPGAVLRHDLADLHPWQLEEMQLRWVEQSPDEALEWIRSGGTAAPEVKATAEALVALRTADAARRTEILRSAPPEAVRAFAEAHPADAWAAVSDASAWVAANDGIRRWIAAHDHEPGFAEALPPEWQRSLAATESLQQASRRFSADPVAARTWFDGLSASQRADALPGVSEALAETQPQQAAGLLATQPRGEGWHTAVISLAKSWANYDPAAARAWIDTLPPITARQAAAAAGVGRK